MSRSEHDQRYAAVCSPADQAPINAALADVSGSYQNMFSIPCLFETDPDPVYDPQAKLWDFSGTTIRSYSTGIVLTTKREREILVPILQQWLTSADWRVVDARGDRYPDDLDLFLAHYQLRRIGGFVNATGLLRCRGGLPSQTIGTSPALISQWEDLEDIRNTELDGTGQRIQCQFAGRYQVEAKIDWDEDLAAGSNLSFQLNMDASPIGPVISRAGAQVQGISGSLEVDFPTNTSKLGVGVWADSAGIQFHMTSGWLGVKRIE